MKFKGAKTKLEQLFKTNDHENHARPLSRREFLAQSAIASTTSFIIPSLTGLISNVIYAQEAPSCALPSANRIPFFVFDEAGGGNIAGGNVMVGGRGGQKDFLSNYLRLGLPNELNPANRPDMIDEQFGLAFHKDSPFLQGMFMGASADVRARCDGVVICAASDNDTGNNPHNPAAWIALSGTVGSVAPALGTRTSDTGGNSTGYLNPKFKHVVINNPDSATGLVDPGKLGQDFANYAKSNTAGSQFGRDAALRVSKAIQELSTKSLNTISDHDLPAVIRNLASCGYVNVPGTINRYSKETLDPRKDSVFYPQNLPFGLSNNSDDANRVATMAKLALGGFSGPATFTRGGYDYHNNNRRGDNANPLNDRGDGGTDDQDYFMGLMIGKTLQAAHDSNKPCFIYVFSDGGITSGSTLLETRGRNNSVVSKFMWTGDCEECAAVFMLAYRPGPTRDQKPMLNETFRKSHQIGAFKIDSGGRASVDRTASVVSSNVRQLSMLVVYNYLAAQGEESRFAKIVGENPFAGRERDYLAFTKLV